MPEEGFVAILCAGSRHQHDGRERPVAGGDDEGAGERDVGVVEPHVGRLVREGPSGLLRSLEDERLITTLHRDRQSGPDWDHVPVKVSPENSPSNTTATAGIRMVNSNHRRPN